MFFPAQISGMSAHPVNLHTFTLRSRLLSTGGAGPHKKPVVGIILAQHRGGEIPKSPSRWLGYSP